MQQRPGAQPPPAPRDPVNHRRLRWLRPSTGWLAAVLPLVAALVFVGWPIPSAATGAPAVSIEPTGVAPSAVSDAEWTRGRVALANELAEAADLLTTNVAAPTALDVDPDGEGVGPAEPGTAAGPDPAPSSSPAPELAAAATAVPPTPVATAAPTSIATVTPVPTSIATPTATPAPLTSPTSEPTVAAGPTPEPTVAAGPPSLGVPLTARETLLLAAMNQARVAAGLSAVTPRADLTDVARARSEEMIRLDYFAHFHPDGHSAYELLAQAGITFSAAGENLVKTYGDVTESVEVGFGALMASPAHRDNILKGVYTRVGVGSFTNDEGVTIITTIFTDR